MVANEDQIESIELFSVPSRPTLAAPAADPPPKLSADRRRTQRQQQFIDAGHHPLLAAMGFKSSRLHPLADETASRTDRKGLPYTCGSCRFRVLVEYHNKSWPKCMAEHWNTVQDAAEVETRTLDQSARISHGGATDVRAWWPACRDYEAGGQVGPDASRVFARPAGGSS